jgi:hypothetical protein
MFINRQCMCVYVYVSVCLYVCMCVHVGGDVAFPLYYTHTHTHTHTAVITRIFGFALDGVKSDGLVPLAGECSEVKCKCGIVWYMPMPLVGVCVLQCSVV